ncbi:MAG TPA: hypothetical protein VGN15_03060 [Ktedonobacteraceae bacterium]|nr:hypothetical protein [Ktedonobacteraceae bacterium]
MLSHQRFTIATGEIISSRSEVYQPTFLEKNPLPLYPPHLIGSL